MTNQLLGLGPNGDANGEVHGHGRDGIGGARDPRPDREVDGRDHRHRWDGLGAPGTGGGKDLETKPINIYVSSFLTYLLREGDLPYGGGEGGKEEDRS